MKNQKLWLVGRVRNWKRNSWDFVAIFTSEKQAIKRCSNWRFFIAPVYLNKFNKGDNRVIGKEWKGAYYPKYGK